MKRITIRVMHRRALGREAWWVKVGRYWNDECPTQAEAIYWARKHRDAVLLLGRTVELVIHRKDRTISPRGGTFPRSSDPVRTKG